LVLGVEQINQGTLTELILFAVGIDDATGRTDLRVERARAFGRDRACRPSGIDRLEGRALQARMTLLLLGETLTSLVFTP
jgi:hypothetical protein